MFYRKVCRTIQIRLFHCTIGKTPISKGNSLETTGMKWLNVAEKNDAAKSIAGILSRGRSTRVRGEREDLTII